MLVFFIHGVATRSVQYADNLKNLIREEFTQADELLPHFYSCFWGNVLGDVGKMWNWVHQDLQELKKVQPQADIDDIFRYKKFREGLLSDFVGDVFTYLNLERGVAIRKLIAQQLYDFLKKNPEENELHIVAHSLGSVILWDVLFSERFSPKDPAFSIRAMVNGCNLSESSKLRKFCLKSITTIGSPILFLNTMLDVRPEKIKEFANRYQEKPLKWINIIHSSDVIAYPIRASLNLNSSINLSLRDEYISADANLVEKMARGAGHMDAALALGAADAHVGYWNCSKTASLIADNILGNRKEPDLWKAIKRLRQVSGMTNDQMKFDINGTPSRSLGFRDGSGKLRLVVSAFGVHTVYVFDKYDVCKFAGYLGWIHNDGLKKEVNFIERNFC